MKNVVQFAITNEEIGYSAEAIDLPIVTEGDTFEELQHNIAEATALFFEEADPTEVT